MKIVEDMEEFLLGAFLVVEELNIVDKKYVGVTIEF